VFHVQVGQKKPRGPAKKRFKKSVAWLLGRGDLGLTVFFWLFFWVAYNQLVILKLEDENEETY